MAFPWTAVATAVSGLLSGYGALRQGKQQQINQEFNAQLEERAISINAAENRERMRRSRIRQDRVIGSHRARRARAGVDPDAGSALLLQTEQVKQFELRRLDLMRQPRSMQDAHSFRATEYRRTGSQAREASFYDAGSTLLQTAINVRNVLPARIASTGGGT